MKVVQIQRLYAERLFSGKAIATDEKKIIADANTTLADLGDLEGYKVIFIIFSDLDLMV
jgi:hypothetical protein